MTCSRVRQLAAAYIDGELGGREMLGVRRHASACDECAREIEGLLEVKLALASMVPCEPPSGLGQRLKARAMAEPARPPRQWALGGVLVLAAAAACWSAFAVSRGIEAPRAGAPDSLASEAYPGDQTYVSSTDPFGSPLPVVPASFDHR